MAPILSASRIAARAPATSVPRPAIRGQRLPASNIPASANARSSATGLPPIHALPIPNSPANANERSVVVFQIRETLILFRRALERTAPFARLPMHDIFDLLGELEILVGDALGRMVLQAHLDPRIGGRDIGMMPGRLRKMADR